MNMSIKEGNTITSKPYVVIYRATTQPRFLASPH